MTTPPKYEDLVLKVAELERRESDLMEKIARAGRVSFSFFEERDAALAREAALREELNQCGSMAAMIEQKEWAEHAGSGQVSSRVESAFTQLHNELADLECWRDLALQFDNHRMKALWHLKTLVSDGAHYDAAAAFLTEPPITATELQQRLTVAEQRAGELEAALKFYADGDHLLLADADAWDTCSGEPINFLHDEAGTASVEDGSIAKAALKPAAEGEGS